MLRNLVLVAMLGLLASGVSRAQTGQAAGVAPSQPAADANQYQIGPGDVVQVFVWRNPDLSVTVPVRPDGLISTPLVENIVAVGRSPSELARAIEVVLAEFIKSPKVNIIVTQPAGIFTQLKVVGQVAKPQAVQYRDGMTVLDAVLQVGGLTQFAAGNRARIIRKVGGKDTEIRVKLRDLVEKGDMTQNLALKPGDVLVVPESLL